MHNPFRRYHADDLIATLPLFDGLSKKNLRLISRFLTEVDVSAGKILTREGASAAEFFIILSGEVEVILDGEVIATRGPGSPLGEIALLERRPRTATLRAKTDVLTLVCDQREFDSLVAVPPIAERLRSITAERREP